MYIYNYVYNGIYSSFGNSYTTVLNHRTTLAWQNYPIYGQPILKIYGKYVVYLKSAITEDQDLKYH